LLSSEPYRCPRLREAATTLSASGGQRGGNWQETTMLAAELDKELEIKKRL